MEGYSSFASANPNSNANAANAPGQAKAEANCGNAIDKQTAKKGVQAGGGPKTELPAPTNCDHVWQTIGAIGNG
jgi:hypothetical protein